MLLIDTDHFKHVNDTHGHQAGDAVLTATAQTIESTLRTEDILGRWGGEEFSPSFPTPTPPAHSRSERPCGAPAGSMT